jgi:hypothetical protein
MNPHLAHLLSCVFDSLLAPEHRADLAKSGLTDATIAGQFIRTVPPSMIPKLLGFSVPAIRSALLFPFRSAAGGFMDLPRVKVFPLLRDRDGHQVKYLQPRGSSPRVYFVGAVLERVLTSDEPLWIVEGEKKALAVAQLDLPAIGLCGVEGWHTAGSLDLLPDFDAIRLAGRVVEVVPDGDYQDNPNVARAVRRFGTALAQRGAQPRAVLLPRELAR